MNPVGDGYISICQNTGKGRSQYIFVFHLHGCRILLVLPLCIGLPAKDIYDGMGHILFGFTDTGVYLLVCEGRLNHCCPDISQYPGSVILTGIFDHAGILCDSPAGGYNVAGRCHHFDQETERNNVGVSDITTDSICVSAVYTLLGIVSMQVSGTL